MNTEYMYVYIQHTFTTLQDYHAQSMVPPIVDRFSHFSLYKPSLMCPGLYRDLENTSLRLSSQVNIDCIKLAIETNHLSHSVNSVPLENPDKHKPYLKPPSKNNLK